MIIVSYRITYGPPVPPPYPNQDKTSHLRLMTAMWFLLFALLVRLYFPAGTAQLQTILLPDSNSITQAALGSLMAELRNGEHLGDALYAFCEEVIAHDASISG